jgi:hypothetical protein
MPYHESICPIMLAGFFLLGSRGPDAIEGYHSLPLSPWAANSRGLELEPGLER